MTLEQARCRAKQLNFQLEIKRQEERRRKIEEEFQGLNAKFTAVIPDVYKTEFEQKYLWSRFSNPGWRKRFLISWRAAQRMLVEVHPDPVDWYDDAYLFYDYFAKRDSVSRT